MCREKGLRIMKRALDMVQGHWLWKRTGFYTFKKVCLFDNRKFDVQYYFKLVMVQVGKNVHIKASVQTLKYITATTQTPAYLKSHNLDQISK